MTIIEWDDLLIVTQLARGNVVTLRTGDEGWAQALADATVSLTQAEQDALLAAVASNRPPAEKPLRDAASLHMHAPMRTQASQQTRMSVHAESMRPSELGRASELTRVLADVLVSEPIREPVSTHSPVRMQEERVPREAEAALTAWRLLGDRLAWREAEHETARAPAHAGHGLRHGEHASHGASSPHVARIAHVVRAEHAGAVSSPNFIEGSPRDARSGEVSSARGASGHASATSTVASSRKRGATVQAPAPWLDGLQPLRGSAWSGRTAQTLLASMRHASLHDGSNPQGFAVPRGARAGGPWLRRVTHAYVGRDGVILWVRDAKLGREGASALMTALHRWANAAGVKVAVVILNGKMIYRAGHADAAELAKRTVQPNAFEVEKNL